MVLRDAQTKVIVYDKNLFMVKVAKNLIYAKMMTMNTSRSYQVFFTVHISTFYQGVL